MGSFSLAKVVCEMEETRFIKLVSSIEKNSEHPLAIAIVEANESKDFHAIDQFESTPGSGVQANIGEQQYRVGNLGFMPHTPASELLTQAQALEQTGSSCIWCADTQQVLGFIALKDRVKADARQSVEQLKTMGKNITMLTGDSPSVAQCVADELGIDRVIAGVLPSDKAEHVKRIQQSGITLMVGDGVNDAPALVQADTSIAIGSGSDISAQHADVVVLKSTLAPIVQALSLSRNTQRIIKQNIVFALSYNAVMVPLAMMAKATPLFAAIVMPISSIIVIGNAMRLKSK